MESMSKKISFMANENKKIIKYITIALCALIFLLGIKSFPNRFKSIVSALNELFDYGFEGVVVAYILNMLCGIAYTISHLPLAYAVFSENTKIITGSIIVGVAAYATSMLQGIFGYGLFSYIIYSASSCAAYVLLLMCYTSKKQPMFIAGIGAVVAYLLGCIFSQTKSLYAILYIAFTAALALYSMSDFQKVKNKPCVSVPASNNINALMKTKELLDAGIITREEFEAKKKELLGS